MPAIDDALERIDEMILPAVGAMLDALLDAAALGRPGHDADVHAGDLRKFGAEVRLLTVRVEEAVRPAAAPSLQRAASAA